MVFPSNDIELFVPLQIPRSVGKARRILYFLFWALVVLGFAHLSYGDFWGFVLDALFALLGYLTFSRLQISSIAFFSFLCAFNTGIDLIATIGLLSFLSTSDFTEIKTMADSAHMSVQQLKSAAAIITLDTIVMGTCLFLSCSVYSDVRANVYSQLGLLGQPLLIRPGQIAPGQTNTQTSTGQIFPTIEQARNVNNSGPVQAFVPFQGRSHRITPQRTPPVEPTNV